MCHSGSPFCQGSVGRSQPMEIRRTRDLPIDVPIGHPWQSMARIGSCWILEATCKAHGAGDHNRFCWLRKGGLTWAHNVFESHCWVPLLGINNSHAWPIFFRRPSTSSAFALSGWTRNLPECRKNVKAGCRWWKNTLGCCVGYWGHLFCPRIAVLYLNVLLHLVIELQWKKLHQ